ncbi:MAG: prolyl oligopeptidase family serine peptidase [Bacteroidales bacterium]|nr:prolyl oligopeptidase family serine peptidase [Bacteroidales bacterium]
MKKTILFILLLALSHPIFTQTLKNITWEDTTRQYLEYVPESYDASTPTPVVFIFHGLGGNMYEVRENADFDRIADAHGWITITPQALPDTFSAMDTTITMNAWHSGVSAIVDGDTIVASEGRDDTGLMMAILDSLASRYNIDTNNIFCTGVSMGGFMSNRMAIEHGDRIKAIASVCGTIGNEIVSYTPVGHVSAMHVHGTADSIVTYDDGNFQYGLTVNVGLGAEATVEFWRNYNQCSDTAVHTLYPDIMQDDRTFERFEYNNGIFGTKTVLIKVNGGQHEWCHGPWRDVDITDEIYEFFASCLGNVPEVVTTTIDNISDTSAICGGEVIAEGSAEVTARGVCWSSSQHPTIADIHTSDSIGTGFFISTLTNLTPSTTYYVRAYATNEVGTAYGDEVCFATRETDTIPTDTIPTDTTNITHYETANLHIFPNPTTGMVNVQFTMNNVQLGNGEIQVLDVYGRLLQVVGISDARISDARSASLLQAVQIDLSQYSTGIYFVRWVNGGKVMAVRKVVKE